MTRGRRGRGTPAVAVIYEVTVVALRSIDSGRGAGRDIYQPYITSRIG